MTFESEILSEIKPSEKECAQIIANAEELKKITESYLEDNGIDAKVIFAGSIGKDTYLRDPDIDMFIMFPEDMPSRTMEALGIEVGMAILNGQKSFTEHPYISGMFKGMEVDMVPCFAVSSAEKIKSSVDRTPYHARYILNNTDPAMRDEMRLMKKFMKGIGTYGAEPHVRGFSGYLCEIITLYYGGFLNALKAVAEWKEGVKLNFGNGEGNFSRVAMIFYDPVDGRRNVASAVHVDTLSRFITAARRYMENPDRRFFFPNKREPFDEKGIRARLDIRGSTLISVSFRRPNVLDDILHSQIWKTESAIEKRLHYYGFDPLRSVHSVTEREVIFVFELATNQLSETYVHEGPVPWVNNADNFLKVWENNPYGAPFILEGRWRVVRKRPFRDAGNMILKEATQLGVGKDMNPNSIVIRDHDETIEHVDKAILTEMLDPRYPWEN